MRSGPSRAIRAPKWLREVRWNISDPFRVEWYNTITIDSDKVSHIMNRFNNFLSVTRSRNGQEINDGAGRDMLEILEACSQEQYRRAKETGTLPLF
ncbi:uncharacterized protein F4822DRAFT_276140 [Hypoxylon trugodes]|uniref:uncharacterized protein n=1 Tax=Hypoxylon trugodes TaxID=326681 RepID=UPI002197EDF3|nr:uncharacterized protein F4822DRAFT_276140 [Hypoxylon trugodes]KAI1387184.1 hypothetical protein F4822DRAFT_276140 [Hypoxylon trugodes]